MRRLTVTIFAIMLTSLTFPNVTQAFSVSPISFVLKPTGSKATGTIVFENSSSALKAIEMKMVTREPDQHGVEHNKSAEDFFLVYPSQFILPPNSKRTVRVSWIGETNIKKELPYRYIAEELDVNLDSSSVKEGSMASMKVMMRYEGVVYVEPSNVTANILFISEVVYKEEQAVLIVVCKNTGSKHKILKNLRADVRFVSKEGGEIFSLGPQELKGINGANMLPGTERKFELILEGVSHSSPVEVDFTYDSSF